VDLARHTSAQGGGAEAVTPTYVMATLPAREGEFCCWCHSRAQ